MGSLYEHRAMKLSLILFFLSFIGIFLAENKLKIEEIPVKNIIKQNINDYVKISGKVSNQKLISENLFFYIKDSNSEIRAVLFDFNRTLEYNKKYQFIGKIVLYETEVEIIISEIKY